MKRNTVIRAVFVDLDGTLLCGANHVSARTIEAFRRVREAGIIPIICTGRLAYESDFAVQAIGADGYLIACNGADVYLDYAQKKRIYNVYTEQPQVRKIIDLLHEQNVFFQAYAENRAYTQKDRADLVSICWDAQHAQFFSEHMVVVDDLNRHLEENNLPVNKFFVGVEREEQMQGIRAALEKIPGIITYASGARLIEVLPERVDKRRAVRAVSAVAGLTREQIMVIGDSENDIGMFDEANICVAMGNACPQLKAKANYYAPSNYDDGVAWALENLLLGEREELFHGSIECIGGDSIENAMRTSTRQYFTGDLKLPQTLPFLFDSGIECGISAYPNYRWEAAHYHTTATEYCYMLQGETKYIDLTSGTVHCFREGDFYVLHRDTPYLQKCKPGCRLLFFKAPGLNDKVLVEMTEQMKSWCSAWEIPWNTTPSAEPV